LGGHEGRPYDWGRELISKEPEGEPGSRRDREDSGRVQTWELPTRTEGVANQRADAAGSSWTPPSDSFENMKYRPIGELGVVKEIDKTGDGWWVVGGG
jgi:hypothetical protein